jgi:hypothetical protein
LAYIYSASPNNGVNVLDLGFWNRIQLLWEICLPMKWTENDTSVDIKDDKVYAITYVAEEEDYENDIQIALLRLL